MMNETTVKWKPKVTGYLGGMGEIYYVAFIYKDEIERRVNDNIKMFRRSAWNDALSAAKQLNRLK